MDNFDLEKAISMASELVFRATGGYLSEFEIAIFKAAWMKNYDEIAAQAGYSTGYIRQDKAPRIWSKISSASGERLSKSNFIATMKRHWEEEKTIIEQETLNDSKES